MRMKTATDFMDASPGSVAFVWTQLRMIRSRLMQHKCKVNTSANSVLNYKLAAIALKCWYLHQALKILIGHICVKFVAAFAGNSASDLLQRDIAIPSDGDRLNHSGFNPWLRKRPK